MQSSALAGVSLRVERRSIMHLIETESVTKTFGEEVKVTALRGVNLQITAGEFVAIMGPSGSGKSSLLHILAGIEPPTTGKVLFEGKNLAEMSDDELTLLRRRRMGFIFQSFNLLPTLTALENVAVPLLLDGISAREASIKAKEILGHVSMGHREDHFPSQLSGGEQQRVAIARALVISPVALFADEPTGNLDTKNGEQVAAILRNLVDVQQQTIVMVTHDPKQALLADRVIHFCDGQIETDELVRRAPSGNKIKSNSPSCEVES
jgi:putative ABC transport system ATP-binding protein